MSAVLSVLTILGLGSIVAALISWRVAISNNRQNWIDALREDLASYFRELESMHYAIGDFLGSTGPDSEKKKREARVAILFIYWRIVLRLNRMEATHNDLRNKLDELMIVREKAPNRDKIEEALDLARQILKREWDVTKYGIWTKPILKVKPTLKRWGDRLWGPN